MDKDIKNCLFMYFVIDKESGKYEWVEASSHESGYGFVRLMNGHTVVKDFSKQQVRVIHIESVVYPYALEAVESGWRGNGSVPEYPYYTRGN